MISVRGKPPSCGVIGCGFVGGAVIEAFKHYTDLKAYDKNKDMGFDYEDVINQDVLFVSLPTPMKANGDVDLSILDGALEKISTNLPEGITGKPVLIKSTVPPGVCEKFQEKFSNLTIMFNPEFLTERTASLDYIQQNRIILGLENFPKSEVHPEINEVAELFEVRFPGVRIAFMSWDEASLVKYFTNVFFSAKVSIFNEFAQIAEAFNLQPNTISEELLNDGRIGRSHWMVPGHDGQKGYSGSCFPKDCNGYIHIAKRKNVKPTMGLASWEKNLEVRPQRDWEHLVGRAVSANGETWKDVPSFPDYEVSSFGRVRSKERTAWNGHGYHVLKTRIMKPHLNRKGYYYVKLRKEGKTYTRETHRLVLKAFKGEPSTSHLVSRHLDGNNKNNHISNLEWGTRKENSADQKKHGTVNNGARNGQAKLTETEVKTIKGLHRKFLSDLAQKFNISEDNIKALVRNRSWKWLVDD